ncbi:MAG TPA: efflux RND transporter periplasmic adaptor subunit [bacterium]|nr:efflux RND transporter periplasmic adaptor subunit [bacterium]
MSKKTRVRVLISLFFAVCVLWAGGCSQNNSSTNTGDASGVSGDQGSVRVKLTTAQIRPFEKSVQVQGNLSAKNFANVSARIPGTLTAIYVNEGDSVTGGKTKLFDVDSVKVKNAVEIRRQDYAVAEQGVNVSRADLEQVDAQLKKAEADLKRITSLYEKEVVSKDTLEKIQTGYDQIIAVRKKAVSAITLSEERLKQAGIALKIAEKDFSDATIYAPISGRVAYRFSEEGEMAAPGYPIVRIEDTSVLEASAFLPSEYYDQVLSGTTTVRLNVSGIDLGTRTVTYKSPTINPKLRTFEVKTVIKNPPESVAPGSMVGFSVILENKDGVGIPSECLQTRSGKKAVFVVEGDQTVLRYVETGLVSGEYTEILDEAVKEGEKIVIEGQNFLDEGDQILIVGEAE